MIPHFQFGRISAYSYPLDHDRLRQYITDIVQLKRDSLSLVQKVCLFLKVVCLAMCTSITSINFTLQLGKKPGRRWS